MVRLLFSLLIGCLSFFAANAQDSTVCIPSDAARYFLEADDERWVLREKDSLYQEQVLTLTTALLVSDSIITTYQDDSSQYASRETTFLEAITLKTKEVDKLEGKLRQRKNLELLTVLGIIIAIIVL